jgi:hypothetical protein
VWSALLDQRTICQNGRPKKLLDTETCMGLKTNPEEITCLDGAPQGPRSLRECLLEPRRPQGEP